MAVKLCGFLILLICCYGVQSESHYLKEKPDYLEACHHSDPEFVKCSTRSVDKLMQQVGVGIPEITEKIGPFDPLKVQDIVFRQDNNEAVALNANITDLIAKGLSKMAIKESKVSKKDYSWETKIFLPKLRLEGKYKMSGKILLIPLNGAGDMFLEIEKLNIIMRTKTRLYEKDGFTFYNVTRVRVDLDPGHVAVNFDNIFNGTSKEVERSTNQFFNDNWRQFFEALRPLVTEAVQNILRDLMQSMFHLIPANFFIEDIPTSEQLYAKNKQK